MTAAQVRVERDDVFESAIVDLYSFDTAKDRDRAKEAIAIARHRLATAAAPEGSTGNPVDLPTTHQGGAAEMREAAARVVAHFERMERSPSTGELDPPLSDDDAVCIKVSDLRALRDALPLPAAEAPQGWQPRIGDRVEPTDDMTYADEWRREPMYVIGIDATRGRDGLNITVANEWPWPLRGDGGTDGFWIGRSDRPDDIRPAAPSTLSEGEGA